ncbi:Os02g0217425 [Oryza sativa Japonica Group]|uniref:Os02g0217425 protein n=1 Tax=Oryza sativa subsp. japonica TaxID=39947 RepID=A0A0P0VGK4_ORYSJ|nr:hypothetical protein EE612_009786 [Oryza sativa]BAS77661.1 Os02g0217425 [Oryza sativa Japonica Group]
MYLLFPDVTEGEDTLRPQHLGGAELPEPAPVLAGRREEDVGAAVEHDLAGEQPGAGGEVGVVRPEHLPRHLPRRRHHQRRLAEPEHHQRAVCRGEVPERAVRQLPGEVVHAADHRQPPWPRRQGRRRRLCPDDDEERLDDLEQRDGEHGEEESSVQELIHGCQG